MPLSISSSKLLKDRSFKLIALSIILCISLSFLLIEAKGNQGNIGAETAFWYDKAHNQNKYNIVLLGDSRTYRGLSPKEMEKTLLGKKVINMGFSSLGFSKEMVDFAANRLSYTAQDPMLVLGITPFSLTKEAAANKHFYECRSISWGEAFESRLFAPVLNRFPRLTLTDTHQLLKGNPQIYQQIYHDDGWVESYKNNPDPTEALTAYGRAFLENPPSPEIIQDLFKLISKLAERGVKIFGFAPPTTDEMLALENFHSKLNWNKFIKDFEIAGGIWIPLKNDLFNSYDGSHLDPQSAKRLSQMIASRIKNDVIVKKPNYRQEIN